MVLAEAIKVVLIGFLCADSGWVFFREDCPGWQRIFQLIVCENLKPVYVTQVNYW